jgi:hypothetical protein
MFADGRDDAALANRASDIVISLPLRAPVNWLCIGNAVVQLMRGALAVK